MSVPNDKARELLGAWALDAVDEHDRAEVERAIAADTELAAEARELRETVAMLAETDAEEPPQHVRETVMAQIRGVEPEDRAQQRDELTIIRRRGRWWALAAAAALLVGIAIPTAVAVNQAERAEQAETQAAQTEQQADDAVAHVEDLTQVLVDPEAEVVGDELPDGSRAVGVLAEDSAYFAAEGMTQLQAQDYQLWVLEDDEAVSAGLLDWDEGRLSAHVEQFPSEAALAVTAEPLGGSDQPTTEPLFTLGSP